jgi:TfoX/Sxy family transcriptional regulator of competence genes
MAYNETTAARLRKALGRRKDVSEKKMFGGLAFLVCGHMCCGITGEALMLRLGEEGSAAALHTPHTRPMDFTGSPLKTMVYVDPPGFASDADLQAWVDQAAAFSATLPPK